MNAQLPAHLQRQSRGVAQQVASLGGLGTPPYLSIRANAFTLIDSVGEERRITTVDQKGFYLDIAIVDSNPIRSKIYWGKDYDPNSTDPPLCWSDNGMAPSRQATVPQHATCGACPHNVIGSATSKVSGKGIKACADMQKIAFVIPGDEKKMIFLLRVPPNSLKPLTKYMQSIAKYKVGDRDMDVTDIVTRLRFDPETLGTLVFEPIGYIDAATAALQNEIWESKAADSIVGKDDVPRTGELPKPNAPQQLQPPPQPQGERPFTSAPPAGQAQPAFTPTTPAASPSEAAPKGRGRPRKQAEPAPPATAAAPAQGMPPMPPFLQRQPEEQQEQPKPDFGIRPGAAPNADLKAALDKAFALPT